MMGRKKIDRMRGMLLAGIAAMTLASAAAWAEAADEAAPSAVTIQTTVAGKVYGDAGGRTLYTSDRDTRPGKSACVDACTRTWKPLAAAWIAGPVGDWSAIPRDDGSRQWAYKGKPLYTYAGDHKAGEINGADLDGAWRILPQAPKFLPAGVAIRAIPYSNLGPALATADGKTLYLLFQYKFNALGTQRHDKRYGNPGPAGCAGACTALWAPLKAPADAKPAEDWTVVARDDGTMQWAYKGWPLYTYAKDEKPGDAMGEAVAFIQNGTTGLMWEVATLP